MSGVGGRPALRVLALAPYPEEAPSTRFRVAQLSSALARLGVDVRLHPFFSTETYRRLKEPGRRAARIGAGLGAFSALGRVIRREDYDVVLVQRAMAPFLNGSFLGLLRRQAVPLVYDFDDAVYLPQERGRPWLERLRGPERTTAAYCRAAVAVLAGNEHLAGFARRAMGDDARQRVKIVPSVVDTERFRPPSSPPVGSGRPTLGWVGSSTTLAYLEALAPALREIAARVDHRLLLVADGPEAPQLPGIRFEYRTWVPEDEIGYFQEIDVGLYPLEESPWTLGKCGLKAVQYLACGVPCVASPVGVLNEIVRDGETGLHAADDVAWVEACCRLLASVEERTRMGRAGRGLVQEAYSLDLAVPRVAEALRHAAGMRARDPADPRGGRR